MQESVEDTLEESQSDEFIDRTRNKSDCEITPDDLRVEYEEVQRAKKSSCRLFGTSCKRPQKTENYLKRLQMKFLRRSWTL